MTDTTTTQKAVELAVETVGSQRELAERIGVARQTVGRWLRGAHPPRVDHAQKLHDETGVPLAALRPEVWGE